MRVPLQEIPQTGRLVAGLLLSGCLAVSAAEESQSIEIVAEASPKAALAVRRTKDGPAIMGTFDRLEDRLVFHPTLPLPTGQHYRFEWREPDGDTHHVEFYVPQANQKRPRVFLRPSRVSFPANALRFYLHFSEPMEQGVFLDRLRLLDAEGREIEGPFRETELWSPDGKRLTVWFHPGRQKQGVNLNEDEGPVLLPNRIYQLVIEGSWRSTAGVSLGDDVRIAFTTTEPDHEPPAISSIEMTIPESGSLQPLDVRFPEALDTAMLATALQVRCEKRILPGSGSVNASGTEWSFVPDQPWSAAACHLDIAPNLEDLAGNSFLGPFEVDVQASRDPVGDDTRLPFRPKSVGP